MAVEFQETDLFSYDVMLASLCAGPTMPPYPNV